MAGLTIVLSGATGAIGGEIAKQLTASASVAKLVILSRDQVRAEALVRHLGDKCDYQVMDLADLSSVSSGCSELLQRYPHIDALINNAATVPDTRRETNNGFELQWGVNVLSYFMLMNALLPALQQGRIINVASDYAGALNIGDLNWTGRQYDSTAAYKQTKMANRMLSWEARKRPGFKNIPVVALMPGVVTSNLLQGLGMRRGFDQAADAAAGPVWLATEARLEASSEEAYYHGGKASRCQWYDHPDNADLWDICTEAVAPYVTHPL